MASSSSPASLRVALLLAALLVGLAVAFTPLPPPPPPSRSVITTRTAQVAQSAVGGGVPGQGGAPLGSWRKAFQRRVENTQPGQGQRSIQLPGPIDGERRLGSGLRSNLAHLASRLTPERWRRRSWGESRLVQAAAAKARAVGSMALAAGDHVADGFLDRIGHPVLSGVLEPLVLEPWEAMTRLVRRWWRRCKRVVVAMTTSFIAGIAANTGAAQAAVASRTKDARASPVVRQGAAGAKANNNNKAAAAKSKVQLVVKEDGPVQKIKGIVVKNPEKTAGGVVAVGGGLYLYKKKRDEDEAWSHLDDDWYYQEDEIPKARLLAKHGQLGDVTLADIDKAVSEGKVALKGKKKDPKARRVTKPEQVIVKEYKKQDDGGVASQVMNLFRKTKAVTRLTSEEQLAWVGMDGERKDAPFITAVAKEVNRLAPVKLSLPLGDDEEDDDLIDDEENNEEQQQQQTTAAAGATLDGESGPVAEEADAAAEVVTSAAPSEDDDSGSGKKGASMLEITAAEAAAAAVQESASEESVAPAAAPQQQQEEPSSSSKAAPLIKKAFKRLQVVLKKTGLSQEEAAEAFANVVNVVVVKLVDNLVPTLKAPEQETIKRVESLLVFMEQAGDLFMKVAPNVTDITPVTYQGQAPARKLEMIYTRYCQQALLEDLEYGNAKAVRIQELLDISNKKADKIAQQILRSQENWMKLLEKQLGPLEQLAGSLGGDGGDLSKMLDSFGQGAGGGFPDLGGEKELKETMEALRAVVQQGGLSDADIEELRRVCSSQGVDLDELVSTMDAVSGSMPAENQELARMFKEALRRNS